MAQLDQWETKRLRRVLKEAGNRSHELTEWEDGFIDDVSELFGELGAMTSLSVKQWEVIFRIEEKLGLD